MSDVENKDRTWLFDLKVLSDPTAKGWDCVYECGSLSMGSSSLNYLLLTELHSLPWFINVSERKGPGTILQSFSFNCSSHMPTLELVNVQPPTTFFNPPSLTRWQGTYVGKVGSWER